MSRKSKILPYKTILNGNLSDAQIIGKSTTVKETDVVHMNVKWSGAQPTSGTFKVEATMDTDPANAEWFELDFGATISISGVSGDHQLVIQQVSFLHVRPVYDRTNVGATGALDVQLFATSKGA